jgi:hypothetical protein
MTLAIGFGSVVPVEPGIGRKKPFVGFASVGRVNGIQEGKFDTSSIDREIRSGINVDGAIEW